MWSYYEIMTAQAQVDRINDASYTLSSSARREFPLDAIRRALALQAQEQKAEKQEGRRAIVTTIANAIWTALRGPAVVR